MQDTTNWKILRDQKILYRCGKYYIKTIAPKGNIQQFGVFQFESPIEFYDNNTNGYQNWGTIEQCKNYLMNVKNYNKDQIIEHKK